MALLEVIINWETLPLRRKGNKSQSGSYKQKMTMPLQRGASPIADRLASDLFH